MCQSHRPLDWARQPAGIRIREINKNFQLVTSSENVEYIERLCTPVREKRLSQQALEVLAIVAYRQPVTKGEIEAIRGIRCDRVLEGLMKRDLVQEAGRSSAIGRPILYGTTDAFLKHFGFQNLKELPDIEDIAGVMNLEEAEEGVETGQLTIEF